MQNGAVKLKELFNGDRVFNIPKYQRTYAWQEENLEYFLDDLLNQRGGKSYFLGTLLFHQKESRGEYEIIDVVDGQQRLTTIIIFMQVIISLLKDRDSNKITKKTYRKYIYDDESYKLELENEDSSFLYQYIFGNSETSIFETPSQKRLFTAKRFFEKRLQVLEIDKLEHIYDVLIGSDVILYIVENISDATQIFELLNDRGRRLTSLEGIKSFLMYKIGCLNLKDNGEQAIDILQDNFSTIYRLIEKEEINESDLLRYHTITFEKSKTDDYNAPDKFIKHQINRSFEKQLDDGKIKEEIVGYVERLRNSFEIFAEIKNNSMECKNFNNLLMIGRVKPFYPLIMKIYVDEKDYFCEFIKNLVKFSFQISLISLRSNGETDFYKWIRNNELNHTDIKLPVEENWWNIKKRLEDVLAYRNFYESIPKNLTKYILFSYENHLRKEKGYPLLSREDYFSVESREKLNIEHITAQRVQNITFDEDFKENYLHSLGNLVIDTTASNSRKGNKEVEEKMGEFIKAPIMSQNEINNKQIDWNDIGSIKGFIDVRNEKLVTFIHTFLQN